MMTMHFKQAGDAIYLVGPEFWAKPDPTRSHLGQSLWLRVVKGVEGGRTPPTDLTVELERPATADEINTAMKVASEGALAGILRYTEDPIVSSDIVTDPASVILDAGLTNSMGTLVKVVGWYDNEWGYSNRLIDLTQYVGARL